MRYEIVKVLLMDNVGVFMKKSLKVLLLVGLAQSAQGFERAQGSRGFGSVVRNVAGATFGGAALATAPLVVHHACKNSQNFMPLMDGLTDNPLLVPTLAVGGGVGLGAGLYASRNDIKNAYNTIKQNTNFNVISSNWFSLASSFSLGYTAATFAGPFLLPEAWVKPAALGVAGVCLVKGLHGASTNEELSRRVGAAEAKLGQDQKFRTTLKEILEAQNNEHGTLIGAATTMRDTKVRFQGENVQLQDSLTAKTKEFNILNNEHAVLNEQHTQFKVGIGAFCASLRQNLGLDSVENLKACEEDSRQEITFMIGLLHGAHEAAVVQHAEDVKQIKEQGFRLNELTNQVESANQQLAAQTTEIETVKQVTAQTGQLAVAQAYATNSLVIAQHEQVFEMARLEDVSAKIRLKVPGFQKEKIAVEKLQSINAVLEKFKNQPITMADLPALQNTGSDPMITPVSPTVSPYGSQIATLKSPVTVTKNSRVTEFK